MKKRASNKILAIRGLDSTVPGAPGESSFPYIGYGSSLIGAGFTLINDPALEYMAILISTTEIAEPTVGDFVGLWFKRTGGASLDILQVQVFS